MAGDGSDRLRFQVGRLFHFGAVGRMSDAQLLDRFATGRDAGAEAAFEELVTRHGPMVLRVSQSLLHDVHDAEDAFQAVFLILANRAGSIRRKRSLASWLFGVAQRVATRARRTSVRQRLLEQRAAERSFERACESTADPDWEILHEEINGLPERLRAPVVLCYLQGLTYAAAAEQLGLSEVAIRGRLARARERLCRQLTRRGLTASAGLLAAGAARQAEAAIAPTLIRSIIRIAQGFTAGNAAAVLARGVLTTMLLSHLRVATVLAGLGLAGSYSAWQAVAAGDGPGPGHDGPNVPTVQLIHPATRTIVRSVGGASVVQSVRRTPVYAGAPGYIEKPRVDIGDKVKKGDVLATVLTPGLVKPDAAEEPAVRRAEDRDRAARAQLKLAEAEVAAARAAVAEAKAIVVKYEADVERWDTEVKRLDREVKRGVVDPQILRESTNEWKSRVAARNAAKATIARTEAALRAKETALAQAKKEPAVRRAEDRVRAAQAQLKLAEAEVAAARAAVAEAKAIVVKYEADVERWDTEVKRLDREVKRGVVDPAVLRDSTNEWKRRVAARDAARATITRTEAALRAKEAALAQAEVELEVAEADLGAARNAPPRRESNADDRAGKTTAELDADANLARALAVRAQENRDLARWEGELKRLRSAVEPSDSGASTPPSRESSLARDQALAAITKAEERLRAYRAAVSKADVDVAVANAAVAVASSEQVRVKEGTGRVTVTAPHDGLIVVRNANALDFVDRPRPTGPVVPENPAARDSHLAAVPLFVVDQIDRVRVLVDLPEQDARDIRVGTRASVQIKGYREEPVEARVTRVARATNGKGGPLRVEIDLPNPDGRLVPGMHAYPRILVEHPRVHALPLAAVTSSGDRSYCWILEQGRAVRTEIRTGVSDGKWIEVERRAPAPRGGDPEEGGWRPWDGSEQVILGDSSSLHDSDSVRVDRSAAGTR